MTAEAAIAAVEIAERLYRGVAQLVARLLWEQDAGCSSHLAPTIKIAVEPLDRLFYGDFYIGSQKAVWDGMCAGWGEWWDKKRGAVLPEICREEGKSLTNP